MIDSSAASRLLRKLWTNPNELARELYELLQSKDARKVAAPVEIAVPRGETALRLTRAPARPRPDPQSTAPQRATRAVEATPLTRTPAPPRRAEDPSPPQTQARVAPEIPQATARQTSPPAPRSNLDPGVSASRPPLILPGPRPPTPEIPPAPPAASTPARPPSSALPPGAALIERPLLPSYAAAYHSPLFEVAGEVRFSGVEPVQFDQPPLLRDPATGFYRPFDFDPGLTRIPRENYYRFWFGEVDTPNGKDKLNRPIYKVKLYAWPDDEVTDVVDVTMWGLSQYVPLTKGHKLWPIYLASDEVHYAVPAIHERIAKTTSVVQPRSGNTPGSGTAQAYNFASGQFVSGPTGDLTVYLWTGAPSGGTGTVPANTWVIIREMYGVWWIAAQDCSGAA